MEICEFRALAAPCPTNMRQNAVKSQCADCWILWGLTECTCLVVFQVNSIAFHPVHGTLATVGSDGRFSFWDKDARTKLKTSDPCDQPITSCVFNAQGNIFAYSASYDWSKVCHSCIARTVAHVFCSVIHEFILEIISGFQNTTVNTRSINLCFTRKSSSIDP